MFRIVLLAIAMLVVPARVSLAEHPLITDDAGTLGRGRLQLELNGEYGRDSGDAIQHTTPTASTLTYGINDVLDVSIGVPYEWITTEGPGASDRVSGFGDIAIAAKWRFYEKDGISIALKPGITLPTGETAKQLGTGNATFSMFFITTKKVKPWALHFNLGYIANENNLDQRVSFWHASIAAEVQVAKGLRIAANTGIQRNTEKGSHTDPAFLLGGLIYSITDDIDIDVGYKYGLTTSEVDHAVLAGMTFAF